MIVLDVSSTLRNPHLTILLTSCSPTWSDTSQAAFQLFLSIAMYIIPLIIMAIFYVQIAKCLWMNFIPSETSKYPDPVPIRIPVPVLVPDIVPNPVLVQDLVLDPVPLLILVLVLITVPNTVLVPVPDLVLVPVLLPDPVLDLARSSPISGSRSKSRSGKFPDLVQVPDLVPKPVPILFKIWFQY